MLRRTALSLAGLTGVGVGGPAAKPSSHLYELRVSEINPGQYDAFHNLSMAMMPKRPACGKCMGYWTVQLGALNQFVSLWQYDNLKHRYDCYKQLDADKEWHRSYHEASHQMMSRQHNMLMRMVFREGNVSTMSYKYLLQTSPVRELNLSGPSAILAATFQVVVGEDEGRYVHLVKARNLDDVIPISTMESCNSKIMGPARWSPVLGCTWR